MRLLDTNSPSSSDALVLKYGQVFTMKSMHGRMLTMNSNEYSAKTFLNAFAQISSEGQTPSVVASNANNQFFSLAASSVQEFLQTFHENSSPSHYGRFVMQTCSSKVKKDTPVCYGHIVHIYYVRDQDQKMESCGKYLIINGNFPQLGFINDSDHQNSEPIIVSAIKTLPLEEQANFPVRIGEDIGLKRIVCNQLDQFYLSARKNNVVQRNKSTNLASWEKFTLCQKDGKSVTTNERNRLLNDLYSQTNYQRDRTIIVSFRNQFKKAVPKENIPTEDELRNVIEKQIGFPVEEISYLDNLNDWSNEQEIDEEEIEEQPNSSLGEAQKEFETPKVLQTDAKDKKIFTKYAKIVLCKKFDRDLLGHFFYYELTKSLYLKFMIPKHFIPSKRH